MSTPAVDPVSTATTLTGNVGGQVVDAAVGIAPIAVPVVLALTAIGWVMRKFGLKRKASLSSV